MLNEFVKSISLKQRALYGAELARIADLEAPKPVAKKPAAKKSKK